MTISAALACLVLLALLVRANRTTIPAALVALTEGFLLAFTGLSPAIHSALSDAGNALNHIL